MKNAKVKNGISLIVLVITIIVLLVLTAAIILSLNNTGIIDSADNATEKTNIQTATEMLTVKLLDLRKPGEVTKDGKITLKDLIVINSTKEEPEMTVETEYNEESEEVVKIYTDEDLDYTKVAVDKYIFKVDEKWGIYLLGEGKFEEIKEPELKGSGTEEDPYIILTVKHLQGVKDNLSAHYKLGTNINLRSIANWEPIGTESTPFTGSLDGDGYTIRNIKMQVSADNQGLFGCLNNARISNLYLKDSNITGVGTGIGFLSGRAKGTTSIYRVYANGNITITGTCNCIGGIIGAANDSQLTVEQCLTEGNIEGGTYAIAVGGVVGWFDGTSTSKKAVIKDSYSIMNVSGSSDSIRGVGGLLGSAYQYVDIINSYSIGKVTGTTKVGALVGYTDSNVSATNSYWNKTLSGQTKGVVGEAKSTYALTKQATYTGWDFESVWGIDEEKSLAYLRVFGVPDRLYDVVANNTEMKGMGTEEDPYIIKTVEDLKNIKDELSAHYKLGNDIDLKDEENWTPLGTSSTPFTGGLDGAGYSISNMKINSTTGYQALFGYIKNATVSNLYLKDYDITAKGNVVGAIAARVQTGCTFYRIHAKGNITITGSSESVGGLLASTNDANVVIEQCFTEGNINGATYAIGVGGLVGWFDGTSSIKSVMKDCYSTMNVTGGSSSSTGLGGLVGTAADNVEIINSYAIGKVTSSGTTNIGALAGYTRGTVTVKNTYWNKLQSGQTTGKIGEVKGISSLAKQATYIDWDFTDVWGIDEGKSLAYLKAFGVPDKLYDVVTNNTEMEGSGTESDPYIIKTVEDLKNVKNELTAFYKLANNLDLSSESNWTPLGDSTTKFTGGLDGAGYTISNLTIKDTTGYAGLFGYTNKAKISNLMLTDYKITGSGQYIGAVVGYTENGTNISKVYTNGTITATANASRIGGIIGAVGNNTAISECLTEGTIDTTGYTGSYIGGLVGTGNGTKSVKSTITNCYSLMTVKGTDNIGGIIGSTSYVTITNTYAANKVEGTTKVGALVGAASNSTGTSIYYNKPLSGQTTSALGVARSILSLARQETYIDWDFTDVWGIDEGNSLAYLKAFAIPDELYDAVTNNTDGEGTGTADDPYIIRTIEELKKVMNEPSAYYLLANNLDLSTEANWTPLGNSTTPFKGNFNGNGYTISNMKINSTAGNLGLFGYVSAATISNLMLTDYTITGAGENIGGLVGYSTGKTSYSKLYAKGNITVTATSKNIGILMGNFAGSSSTMDQCLTEGTINALDYGTNVGGLLGNYQGANGASSVITNTYSLADVSGKNYVSGLIGYGAGYGQINYSYAAGKVTGTSNTAGITAYAGSWIRGTNSYWIKTLTGQTTSKIGEQKSVSALSKQAGYISWNFESIWGIDEGKSLAYLKAFAVPDKLYDVVGEYNVLEGNGTADNPYIIKTVEELKQVMDDPAAYYKLGNNIDLKDETNWTPIGNSTTPFTGGFDGAGYTISNMKINSTSGNLGLFGYISAATISNLTIADYTITGSGNNIGGLVGYTAGASKISKVHTKGNIITTANTSYIGGLIGKLTATTSVDQCLTEGTIDAKTNGSYVGGVIGHIEASKSRMDVTNTYSIMTVKGNSYVGGFAGYSQYVRITNTYAVGKVEGTTNVSGFANYTGAYVTVTSSYWNPALTGQSNSSKGAKMSIESLVQQESYTGWNFDTIWEIDEGKSFAYLKAFGSQQELYDMAAETSYPAGSGSEEDPYIITKSSELDYVRVEPTVYYKLGNTIDLSEVDNWSPIGNTTVFSGNFNGNGYAIKNMKINATGYSGLFGKTSSAKIYDLILEDYNITGAGSYIGALAGHSTSTTITNITLKNGTMTLTGASNYVGGITGYAYSSALSGVKAEGYNITGNGQYIGGVLGSAERSTCTKTVSDGTITIDAASSNVGGLGGYTKCTQISLCSTKGNINAGEYGTSVGGFLGAGSGLDAMGFNGKNSIANSYSTVKVEGKTNVGGFIGKQGGYCPITNCYSIGKVTGTTSVGGFVGLRSSTRSNAVTSSYWDTETSGQTTSAIGTGKTTAEMQTQSTYSGWDFDTIWQMNEGEYPTLR